MPETSINFLAVLVGGLVYWLIGGIWFSKMLFGKAWMKHIGKTEDQVKADFTPMNYLWALITSLLVAYGLARILVWMGYAGCVTGMKLGLVTGVCFAIAIICVNNAFDGRPKALTYITGAYHLVAMILTGAVIGSWGRW